MDQWVTAASSLLAFLLYYNTLDAGFVYDDRRAILSNPDVIGHTPIKALFENDFWGTPLTDPGSHGSYRPLCVATYRLNYAFSGFKPWSYHLLNVFFHSTATALVVITAKRLLPTYCMKVGTVVTGLSFASHPIHTEAVAGIVGRADLAACNFFLLSFLLYTEHLRIRNRSHRRHCRDSYKQILTRHLDAEDQNFRLSCHGLVQQLLISVRKLLKAGKTGPLKVFNVCEVSVGPVQLSKCHCNACASEDAGELLQWCTLVGTLLFATAATLCKEPAIMVVPLCIIYDFLRDIRQDEPFSKYRWRSICALSTGGLTLLYWRLRIAGAPSGFAAADNPTARDLSFFTRFYTFTYLPVFNFFLLLYPFHLSFDWSMDAIPKITSIFDARNISSLIVYAAISKVSWKVLTSEIKRQQEKKDRFYKKQKTKQKWNNNCKHFSRRQYCSERKSNMPQKENASSKRSLCPCNGCKHSLTEEHTNVCRTVNNNNIMMHNSCVCPTGFGKAMAQRQHKHTYRSPQIAMLLFTAFMVLPFVPASNILFYVGFVVAERVLYIPSVGFCLLLGLGAGALTRTWRRNELRSRIFMFTLLVTLCAMCGATLRRNLDWRDEESLFRSALHINPPKAYGNLGSVLSTQGRVVEAEAAFERALKYRPNMADVHYNLGILHQNQRRYAEAIKSFEKAIYFRPSMALAYVNLGTSLMADGRLAEATSALRAGARADGIRVRDRREHDAARVSALVQLAALHSRRGHWHKALSSYKEALQILPVTNSPIVGWTRHNVLTMAGDIYIQLQQWAQAEHSVLSALALAPGHAATYLSLAQIVARNTSRNMEAETWFKKAITLAPDDPAVRDQFGMFLRSQRRLRESAEQLVTAARLSPTDSTRAASAARALRDARKCRSAERWYARAVELNPNEAEYHSNLGAILHLNGKYVAAASSYRRALQLQPNDQVTITNLKRVRTLMSNQRKK
ncbi:protein O-mannosyl-transferase TMTC1-like [Pieris brassicae]|uniref:protein O-mannosyl-transferase TMTC1-like n=1 Tax=Pieris brassicae TaxID=7116 RepID=UPI001E660464|nr:protein O-mannosyl-transferase TMTC1-like [Pieris brassicae]XP_045515740.1 protein O-mannosyl-transferase TMTC1-like [Pieris brassicae]